MSVYCSTRNQMAAINLLFCFIFLIPYIAGSSLQSRIINGTVAKAENNQHQVSIRSKEEEIFFGTGHICGGSLIAPNVVLTAAHCFYDYDGDTGSFHSYENFFVVMGTMNRVKKTKTTVSMDLVEIITHGFDPLTFANDIALVILKENMPISSNPEIKLIPMNREVIPEGTICQVTGWGVTENGTLSENLMTVDLPIIGIETCSTNYEDDYISEGMICAGFMEGEKDACAGDSGGPMVSKGKLVGIVSFGDGCADAGYPGIYTDVRQYADWIDETIANLTAISTPEENKKPENPIISVNVVSLSFNFFINLDSQNKNEIKKKLNSIINMLE